MDPRADAGFRHTWSVRKQSKVGNGPRSLCCACSWGHGFEQPGRSSGRSGTNDNRSCTDDDRTNDRTNDCSDHGSAKLGSGDDNKRSSGDDGSADHVERQPANDHWC